jgi:hypothetical protein
MPRGRRAGLAVAALLSAAARTAAADELRIGASTVEVTIVADADARCPTEAAFREAVRAAVSLPGAGATAALPASRFEVLITADRTGATSTLTIRSDGAESALRRTVRGPTCREAAEAIALVVVMSIDPLASPGELQLLPPEPPPKGETRPPPAPRPVEAPRTVTTPDTTSRHRVRFAVVATGGGMVGLLPRVAPVTEATLVATLPTAFPLELRAGAGAFLPDALSVGAATVDFWGVRARGSVCPAWRLGASGPAPTFGACAGGTLDWIFTYARGFPRVTTTGALIPSMTTGGFVSYDFGPRRTWSIGLDADLAFVLVATSWTVVSVGEVHHTSPLAMQLGAFVRVNFP